MTEINHQDAFSTLLSSTIEIGATTSPVVTVPTIDVPFYVALDATNVNDAYEVVKITGKTATNINHAATTYAHDLTEEIRIVLPAVELDEMSTSINDGWIADENTWVYASATTFTIASTDLTDVFTKGTKLKCTNSTTKYFYVVSSSFSTNTTVTVTGESDLADAAITANFFSYNDCPRGFKKGQDWYKARVHNGTQMDNLTDDTDTQITLDSELYDTNSNFATNAYTAPITGYYFISAQVSFVNTVPDKQYILSVKKDASVILRNEVSVSLADRAEPQISDVYYLEKGDVLTLWGEAEVGVGTVDVDDGATLTYMTVQFIGI